MPDGRGGGADEDVGLALRAEDGNAVHQFAEHHLHGPRQAEPDRDSRQFGRAQRQPLLDPHVAADIDESQRAIGEIDHRQRQVAQPEAPDRPQQRRQPEQAGSLGRRLRGRLCGAQRQVHATVRCRLSGLQTWGTNSVAKKAAATFSPRGNLTRCDGCGIAPGVQPRFHACPQESRPEADDKFPNAQRPHTRKRCAARGSRGHQALSCPHLLRSGIEP